VAPFYSLLGWDGCALLVSPQESLAGIQKNIFDLGADKFLERLESKTRKGSFF
jgi:hypothetical protein